MIDEGYVKYLSDWRSGPPPDTAATDLLEHWRKPLFDAGLVGHYADLNIGYGNISIRFGQLDQFVISGTQTGHIAVTSGEHYALVEAVDILANTLICRGPVQASSEAMTHAALYQLDRKINAVVHVHSKLVWQQVLHRIPTTSGDVPYGTPEMAQEFARLYRETTFARTGLAAMAGHDEGIVAIGTTLRQAAQRILQLNADVLANPAV